MRPVHHPCEDRIRGTSNCAGWPLLLIRVIETTLGQTWRTARHELDRMHLVTLATDHGTVAQRSITTPGQRTILTGLTLPEPPRFDDFAPAADQLEQALTLPLRERVARP